MEIGYQFGEVPLQQRPSGDKPAQQYVKCSICGLRESRRARSPYHKQIKISDEANPNNPELMVLQHSRAAPQSKKIQDCATELKGDPTTRPRVLLKW